MALFTSSLLTDFLTLSVVFISVTYFYLTRNFNYWKKKNVQHEKPIPFFGTFKDALLFKITPAQYLAKVYSQTEGDFSGIYLFSQPGLVLKNPETIKTILIKDFNHFQDRYVGDNHRDDPEGTYNIFNAKNPVWHELRTKITPVFTSGKLKQMFNLLEENGEDLVKYIKKEFVENENKNEEMKDIAARYLIDVIANCAFGFKADCLKESDSPFWIFGNKILTFTYGRAIQFLTYFFAPQYVKPLHFKFIDGNSRKFLCQVFTDSMNQRVSSGIKRNDLIDILLKIKNGK